MTEYFQNSQKNNSNLFSNEPQNYNFFAFCLPDSYNVQLYQLYFKEQYQKCLVIIQNILLRFDERLCTAQLLLAAKVTRDELKIQESLNWFQRALKHNPYSTKILNEIGKTYYLLGEHKKAINIFIECINHDSNNWQSYYWQSLSYYHFFSPPECSKKAKEILTSFPNFFKKHEMVLFLAQLLSEQNEIEPCIEAYKRSIMLEPENVEQIHKLGMIYLQTKNEENAFAMFGKVLSIDLNYVPSILAIASILQNRGDLDVALKKYRLVATKLDYSSALWNNIGMCYYGKEKYFVAIICLKKANYLNPFNWKTLYNLSLCYYSLQQFASAYHFVTSALAISPLHPIILMMLALTLTKLNDFDNAKATYKKALKLAPKLPVISLNFAIFEYNCGNLENSIKLITFSLRDINSGYGEIDALANRLNYFYEKAAAENKQICKLLQFLNEQNSLTTERQ